MRRGCVLYINRFASLLTRSRAGIAAGIAHLITAKTPASATAILLALVLSAQAQGSIQEVALPPWSEPTLPSGDPPASAQTETLPSGPEPLTAAPAEPLPASAASLPASEEVFPPSSDSWSSPTNYTTAQTTVVPAPAAGGP